MANQNSGKGSKVSVPEAKAALNNMKYEIANELGVNLKEGYNGDLTSREAGYVGGYMVNNIVPERTTNWIRGIWLRYHNTYNVDVTYCFGIVKSGEPA